MVGWWRELAVGWIACFGVRRLCGWEGFEEGLVV